MVVRHILLAICLSAALSQGLPGAEQKPVGTGLAVRVCPFLVAVEGQCALPTAPWRLEAPVTTFRNTGFFVSPDGHVLTSIRAVAGCQSVRVVATDGTTSPARVLAADQVLGLALLETDRHGCKPISFAEAAPPEGTWLALASVPGSGRPTPLLVPALLKEHHTCVMIDGVELEGLLGVVAPVPPGSAGAPVLDLDGRAVGVLVGARSTDGTPTCCVLPAPRVSAALKDLLAGRSRRVGWLGVSLVASQEGTEGVQIWSVLEGSPAHKAGLKPGDVLLQMGEQTLVTPRSLSQMVARVGPGHSVEFKVLRGGRILTVPVRFGPRPLLITSAARDRGEGLVRIRVRTFVSDGLPCPLPFDPAALLQENRRLRQRVEDLERQLQRVSVQR